MNYIPLPFFLQNSLSLISCKFSRRHHIFQEKKIRRLFLWVCFRNSPLSMLNPPRPSNSQLLCLAPRPWQTRKLLYLQFQPCRRINWKTWRGGMEWFPDNYVCSHCWKRSCWSRTELCAPIGSFLYNTSFFFYIPSGHPPSPLSPLLCPVKCRCCYSILLGFSWCISLAPRSPHS